MSQVILIRPGATLYDEQNRVQGVLDIPLSEQGHDEVARMAREIAESLGESSLSALYTGPGENAIRTAEIVGKVVGVRPKRINDFRNLDQGLWQGLQIDEIKRRNTKAVPPVDRRPGDDLSPPGRDRREGDGADQVGLPAAAPPAPGRGDRPGGRRAAGPAGRLLPAVRAPRPARRTVVLLRLRVDPDRPRPLPRTALA